MQQIREHNNRAWAVWHIAALNRISPRKPLPKLEKLLRKVPKPAPRRQTSQEQWAIMEQWARVMQQREDQKKRRG